MKKQAHKLISSGFSSSSDFSLSSGTKAALTLLVKTMLVSTTLGLAACQSGKVVDTVDDSADYRSARALPPLKRADQVKPGVSVAPEVSQPKATALESESTLAAEQGAPVVSVDTPSDGVERESIVIEPNIDNEAMSVSRDDDMPSSPQVSSADELGGASSMSTGSMLSSLVSDDDATKLEIQSDFEGAWSFLTGRLVESELTVFSRNKAAGRISIGCGDISDSEKVEVSRAGGWSIFNRRKAQASEYCALQTEESKGRTLVSVLNRSGQEVGAEYGRNILNKIINN